MNAISESTYNDRVTQKAVHSALSSRIISPRNNMLPQNTLIQAAEPEDQTNWTHKAVITPTSWTSIIWKGGVSEVSMIRKHASPIVGWDTYCVPAGFAPCGDAGASPGTSVCP